MFPDYLKQTPETSDELFRARRALSGLEASLLKAIFRAWHIRPCRERMPCLNRCASSRGRFNLRTAVAAYWNLASASAQAAVQEKFLQLLFWRQRDYPAYELLNGGMEQGQLAGVFQEDFGNWCEDIGQKKCDSVPWLMVQLIRLSPSASKNELAYCLEPLDTLSAVRLGAAWFHLLTRICCQAKISRYDGGKILAVQFSPETELRAF